MPNAGVRSPAGCVFEIKCLQVLYDNATGTLWVESRRVFAHRRWKACLAGLRDRHGEKVRASIVSNSGLMPDAVPQVAPAGSENQADGRGQQAAQAARHGKAEAGKRRQA
jgi:hypothetical protein